MYIMHKYKNKNKIIYLINKYFNITYIFNTIIINYLNVDTTICAYLEIVVDTDKIIIDKNYT